MQVILVDLGGTHIRFAIANISKGQVLSLGDIRTFRVADYERFRDAWRDYKIQTGSISARAASVAVAGCVEEGTFKLVNNPWTLQTSEIVDALQIDDLLIINDFGAVGHAVATVNATEIAHISGPKGELHDHKVISVIGPGTGLGVAQLIYREGSYTVIETEGGHASFAPVDDLDDFLLQRLRGLYGRVSVERIVSGAGLKLIYEALAAREGRELRVADVSALWDMAISNQDALAALALDRFCRSLGSAAGDIALMHGSSAVVLSGTICRRMARMLSGPSFTERFRMKGRFESRMAGIPVALIIHPEPGVFGAAAAFAQRSVSGVSTLSQTLTLA